ncbi:hypothetical protein [Tautonia sociabilis]|uniref:DUF2569 family protein n=1 Tax=Tautonia sociabilis TaxID=2080755 RepID=A0A432MJR2_9BACT|nr:hypothetical protein [Tautonia sociabilis]RUL87368.1 hypothetical protein TsocGM_12625 [Tautonia sociabilis]
MSNRHYVRRPGILNAITFFSLILSLLNVVWVVVIGAIATVAGVAGWLLGPVAGAVGSIAAVLVILVLLIQSAMGILLFMAGWITWSGDPRGRSLHLAWAWITVVIDLLDLAFTAGIDGGAWVRLIYAGVVILVMNREDVKAYFLGGTPIASKTRGWDDWS